MSGSRDESQHSVPSNSSGSAAPRNFNFFRTAKLVFWTFLIGLITGGMGSGYVVLNADRLNLPFLPKGNNNTQTTNKNSGNQVADGSSGNAGSNSGNQAGGSNSGNIGNGNAKDNSGIGNITASGNSKIDIRITPNDPKFQNDKLPGYFPNKGFEAQPPQLDQFEGANVFTRDLVVAGDVNFTNGNVVIRGRNYVPILYLEGSNREARRVAFKLNGSQKGALLQFGLNDLNSGNTNLTYQVDIAADGKKVWTGRVIYGSEQQLLSVPIDIPGATTLTVEYIISQGGDNPRLNLIFTRAELLYK